MRHALLIAALLPACATSSEHTISGRYNTSDYNGPPVYDQNGNLTGASVVQVTAADPYGGIYDQGTFHDPTVEGAFQVSVPDGAAQVHLIFIDITGDGNHRADYGVDDPVYDDITVGTVYLP